MSSQSNRVIKYRETLRKAGLRPVQLWLPDARGADFANEAARQCSTIGSADPRHKSPARGDVVSISRDGESDEKVLVIQSALFGRLPTITVLPLTDVLSEASLFRIPATLEKPYRFPKSVQIMVDQARTIPASQISHHIGSVDRETMTALTRSISIFFGLA